MITLRRVSLFDFFLLYKWVNNEEVARLTRLYSKTSIYSHTLWFFRNFRSKKHILLKIFNVESYKDLGLIQLLISENIAEFRIKIIEEGERGKGFGSQAIRRMLDEIEQYNLTEIYLFVRVDNQHAINLYEKYGFTFSQSADFISRYSDGQVLTKRMTLALKS